MGEDHTAQQPTHTVGKQALVGAWGRGKGIMMMKVKRRMRDKGEEGKNEEDREGRRGEDDGQRE